MRIVAAIPSFDRSKMLERCRQTLSEQGVTEHRIAYNVAPTAQARNAAIEQCPEDALILWCDDDCWYDERLNIQETASHYKTGQTGIIQITRLMPGKAPTAPKMNPVALTWTSGGMLFHKSVWREVGGVPIDYLDDVMFSAKVHAAGYRNHRSTFSYGHHDVDTKKGGMSAAIALGKWNDCHPERYHVTGEPCHSKGGLIPNIKNIRATPELHALHKQNRRAS